MTKKLNVLSLFNGCGMLRPALDNAGIEVENYYSSEIDKYASEIANKNYPDTIQLGDVTKWSEWDLPKIDLLTAGFPCQDLSVAGKQLGLNGERSGLLYDVLKIRDDLKPKYFLFENVASMSQHWRDEITRLVGVNPVELNSKYWGAQNRARLFWTNIPGAKNIEMTQVQNDRKIYLKDILIDGLTGIAQAEYDALFINSEKQLQILKDDVPSNEMVRVAEFLGGSQGYRVYGKQGKSQTLAALGGGAGAKTGLIFSVVQKGHGFNKGKRFDDGKTPTLTSNSWEHNNHITSQIGIRKLHPIECERLMNLSDNYTQGLSKTQCYKMVGTLMRWQKY